MELEHSFTVPVPPEQAWQALLDVEKVAPCMPGATVDSVDGDVVKGRIKVKVGPVTLTYSGTARFVERDDEALSITLEASGKETRGSGTASAKVRSTLRNESGQTQVVVHTTLSVTGRPAQFGRGVMAEVSGKIIQQFATNLAVQLGGEKPPAGQASGSGAVPQPPPQAKRSRRGQRQPTAPPQHFRSRNFISRYVPSTASGGQASTPWVISPHAAKASYSRSRTSARNRSRKSSKSWRSWEPSSAPRSPKRPQARRPLQDRQPKPPPRTAPDPGALPPGRRPPAVVPLMQVRVRQRRLRPELVPLGPQPQKPQPPAPAPAPAPAPEQPTLEQALPNPPRLACLWVRRPPPHRRGRPGQRTKTSSTC